MRSVVSLACFMLLQSAIYDLAQSCNRTDNFNQTWFGAGCQYKCHCANDSACHVTSGDCPNGCDSGWFGPACQYADLAETAQLTLNDGISQDITKITDGDDTTCAALTDSSFSLHITWTSNIYFTWLRLVVANAELQKESISIKFPEDVATKTVECLKVFIDQITIDIYCNISKPIRQMFFNGSAVSTLCSLYISKGRNVALKQPTNQTSTSPGYPSFKSSSAVDGNPSWDDHSCTHTIDNGEPAPKWTLYFQSIVRITSYTLYNRVGNNYDSKCCLDRLKGFILKTFDQTNNIVQYYTDTETSALEVYNVLSTDPLTQVSKVQITATNPSPVIILTLCEVEIFGDSVCSRDKFTYGRDCENLCNCAVPGEKCFVSTGNCPSGCKAGFYGQGCNKTCESGYFGINCRNKCRSCSSLHCDTVDGKCTSCAFNGKKMPYCTEDCDPGFYGSECRSNCSKNCAQTGYICDVTDGKCFGCKPGFYGFNCTTPCSSNCNDSACDIKTGNCATCKSGFHGNDCSKSCPKNCQDFICEINSGNCTNCNSGFYGPSCTTSCPTNCKQSLCDRSSGSCVSCKSGFQGVLCVEECSNYTYGEDCKICCSPNCNTNVTDARVCDRVIGNCLNGCRSGYLGGDCSQSTSKWDIGGDHEKGLASGVGIGIGVMIAAGIVIGIVIYIWFKRRQKHPPKPRDTAVRSYDQVDQIQQNEHPYNTADKSGDGYDLIKDVVSFNKNSNSVVTEVDRGSPKNTGGSSVSS